jgi:hypothetical protein
VSFVYGQKRSFKARGIKVVHHTGAHGKRYEVDRANERLLPGLLKDGKATIEKWMRKHEVPVADIQQFNGDKFGMFALSSPPQ